MGEHESWRLSTGSTGLDDILAGGLIPRRSYLVRGGPGCGKTTLGIQFLAADPQDPALLITMGEQVEQLREDAERQGFDLSNIDFLDLTPVNGDIDDLDTYAVMAPADTELVPSERIREACERYRPKRIFIDSLSHLSYLAPDGFQYRKQVMGLLRYLTGQGATVMSAAEGAAEAPLADELQFLADGIINLAWSANRRIVWVSKYRGSSYSFGEHTLRIEADGIHCFPRLEPGEHGVTHEREEIGTGIEAIDHLLSGGVTRGTTAVFSGPTGVGKTTMGLQFLHNAARQGRRGALYTFEENLQTLRQRAASTGMPIDELEAGGDLTVESIEPLRYSPDEFTQRLRRDAEQGDIEVVMIDSLSGYRLSIAGADVVQRVSALCRYLTNMGVTVLLINETSTITGNEVSATDDGISFLADTIVMLRYLEMHGELRKAIGVLKKRTGDFEKTLREFDITSRGIEVGEPLSGLRGILGGAPDFVGNDRGSPG